MTNLKLAALLTKIAALSALATDVTFTAAMESLFGVNGPKIVAGISIAAAISGEVLHLIDGLNPPTPPTTPVA